MSFPTSSFCRNTSKTELSRKTHKGPQASQKLTQKQVHYLQGRRPGRVAPALPRALAGGPQGGCRGRVLPLLCAHKLHPETPNKAGHPAPRPTGHRVFVGSEPRAHAGEGTHMTVVFPAPFVPSRAVICPRWQVRLRPRTAGLWGWCSLVTDTRVTPGGLPSSSAIPSCGDDPARNVHSHPEGTPQPPKTGSASAAQRLAQQHGSAAQLDPDQAARTERSLRGRACAPVSPVSQENRSDSSRHVTYTPRCPGQSSPTDTSENRYWSCCKFSERL